MVGVNDYRAWKCGGHPDRSRLTLVQMLALTEAIPVELKGAYGSPHMLRELRDRGFRAINERIERLIRENGIKARHKRYFTATTDSEHALPVAPNLSDRDFQPAVKNRAWTTDIVINALTKAWFRRKPVPGLIHHSNQGGQYAGHTFQVRRKEYAIACSMNKKGGCRDNTPSMRLSLQTIMEGISHEMEISC